MEFLDFGEIFRGAERANISQLCCLLLYFYLSQNNGHHILLRFTTVQSLVEVADCFEYVCV